MRKLLSTLLLLLIASPAMALTPVLWQSPETGSGHIWPGWNFSTNVDTYGSAGFYHDNSTQIGANEWVPRIMAENGYGGTQNMTISTTIPPYRTSGRSLKVESLTPSGVNGYIASHWIPYYNTNFGSNGYSDNTTNRYDFYMKWEGSGWTDPVYYATGEVDTNVEIGTYNCWTTCPAERAHYYHQLAMHAGGWLHVQLNEHPEHRRGDNGGAVVANDPLSPYHYFQTLYAMYIEAYAGSSPAQPIAYYLSDFKFSTVTGENEGIGSLWVGYFPATGKWEISFSDMSFTGATPYNGYSQSRFDVRYSLSPITNANFSSATQIVPLFNNVGSNLLQKNTWGKRTWTNFTLPSSVLNSSVVYFAIKDVSSTVAGDNHNTLTNNIRTIDYKLGPGGGSPPPNNVPMSPYNLMIQ